MFEVQIKVGDGLAAAEFDEDMVFDGGKDGEEGSAGGAMIERPRELVSQFGVRFEFAMGGVEPAEGCGRGLEVESFGFGLGEDLDGFGVGVVLAEGDDELFVLVREGVEFVQFHTAMF